MPTPRFTGVEMRVPRVSCLFFFLPLFLTTGTAPGHAQGTPTPVTPIVRYHFGDDPAWASAAFDDISWQAAQQGQWSRPSFYSDGFVWVRLRVPVRSDTAEPLALQVGAMQNALIAYEVFVNGTRVGSFGKIRPANSSRACRGKQSLIRLEGSPIPESLQRSRCVPGIRPLLAGSADSTA
jgi:hypothetical protein